MNDSYLVSKILGSARRFALFLVLISLFLITGIGIAWYFVSRAGDKPSVISSQPNLPSTGDETSVGDGLAQKLTVNAQLQVNGQFYLAPSSVPDDAEAGTLVFDQATSTLQYFNGTSFVALTAQEPVPEAGVTSLQGQTGAVTLTPGAGISINGTTINNSGILGINGVSGHINVTTANGIASLSLPQSIATTASPTFNGLTLGNALPVGSGGTGGVSFGANSVLIGNGSGAFGSVGAVAPGQCLISTAGAPAFGSCAGGGSGVDSFNALTGNLTLANASGVGATITIDNASTSAKGIAQFNSTNFSVAAGVVNTIQGISVSASPTFAGLTLSAPLAITSGGTGSASAAGARSNLGAAAAGANTDITSTSNLNTITPSGTLTVGSAGQQLILQGNGSTLLRSTSGGFTTTLSFTSPTANTTINLPALSAGTYTLCTTSGNCTGVGGTVTSPGGTPGVIAKFTGTNTLDDSLLSESGSVVTVGGSLVANSGVTVGVSSTTNGQIVFRNSTNGNTLTLQSGATGANTTFTLPVSDGTSGQCLKTNASGVLSFGDCLSGSGGSGGVTALNTFSGSVTLQGTANQISISNNTGTITLSTPQDINTTSSPTFAGLTITSLTVAGDTINDFTGTGLQVVANSLQATLGTSVDLTAEVTGTLPVANGGTGATTSQAAINNISQLTTNGDLLYHNGTNSTRLARGTAGQCLVSTAGSVQWGSCAGSGSGVSLQAAYDNGNTITTTDNRNIHFTLADTANDASFVVELASVDNAFMVVNSSTGEGFVAAGGITGVLSNSAGGFSVMQESTATPLLTVHANVGGEQILLDADATMSADTIIGNASSDRLTVTSHLLGASPLVFQGATDNGFETTFAFTDPTADRTITFGDESGTVCTTAASAACLTAYQGSSPFTDAGSYIYAATTTDELVIGSNASLGSKLAVVNTSDQEALVIRAFSSQTNANPLVVFQPSGGGEIARINVVGTTNSASIYFGYLAGANDDGTANENTGIGRYALNGATTGTGNAAFGQSAGRYGNGTGNVSVGHEAGWRFDGVNNVAIGLGSMSPSSSNTGNYNTALGYMTMNALTSGNGNTALGVGTLRTLTSGSDNVAVGNDAMRGAVSGDRNVAIGKDALYNSTDDGNIAIGYQAGDNLTAGTNNIVLGYNLDFASATGSNQLNIAGLIQSTNYATGNLTIGTSDTTGQLLVIDTKTGAGDPTGVNGGMYYNSNAGKFRCFENSSWVDCISGGGGGSLFTDGGTQTYLTSTTDELVVGGSSSLGAKLSVVNTSDQEALLIRAHSAQTNANPLVLAQNSSGTELFRLHAPDDTSIFLGSQAGANDDGTNYNTGIGYLALNSNTSGSENLAFGRGALQANTTGSWNTAIGSGALIANTSGGANTAVGEDVLMSNTIGGLNVGVGNNALQSNISGGNNTAIGQAALASSTTASYNVAVGTLALQSNVTGESNTAVGEAALQDNTGSFNTALGNSALRYNATGTYNIALGMAAMRDSEGGQYNFAAGYQALYNNTGSDNFAAGYQALYSNTSGNGSIALGRSSLRLNTTGTGNISVGYESQQNTDTGNQNISLGTLSLSTNTSGSQNISLGFYSLQTNTTGSNSVAIGAYALQNNATGGSNIALGEQAMQNSEGGSFNFAAGYTALYNNTGGGSVAIGNSALAANTSGNDNIALGSYALWENTTGGDNIAIGKQTLNTNSSGSMNVALGVFALQNSEGGSHNFAVGYAALQNNTGSSNIALGNSALNNNVGGGINIALGESALQNNSASQANIALGYQSMRDSEGGSDNIALGYQSLMNTTSNHSIAIGHKALMTNTTGGGIAIGLHTLENNSSGSTNIAIGHTTMRDSEGGSDNVALGYQVLLNNTGTGNVALGHRGLEDNTSGGDSIAIGRHVLQSNATGSANIALGLSAMQNSEGGQNNIAIGNSAMSSAGAAQFSVALGVQALNVNEGNNNIALGYQSQYSNTTGADNVAIGMGSLTDNVLGVSNTAVGTYALYGNSSGSYNTAVGRGALAVSEGGSSNVAIGYEASMNNTGDDNIALGYRALLDNSGDYNVAIGRVALMNNTSGSGSIAIGYATLYNDTTGPNTAIGHLALNCITGSGNTAVGYQAGSNCAATTANNNVFLGHNSGAGITTGDNNVLLGYQSGNSLTSGTGNILIGYDVDVDNATDSNKLKIGNLIQGDMTTNQLSLLNSSPDTAVWNTTTALPSANLAAAMATANGYVYMIGGGDAAGTTYTTVRYAKVNADGTLGNWTAGTALPNSVDTTRAVAYNGYMYVTGGWGTGVGHTDLTYYAKINLDGSLGSWTAGTVLPAGRSGHAMSIMNGYVYVFGGGQNSAEDDVYYAKINSNGSIGSWTTLAADMTANMAYMGYAVANNYVYLVGGSDSGALGTPQSHVYYAKLNSDGTVGAWSAASSLPAGRVSLTSFVSNGYLYAVGGHESFGPGGTDEVYYAKINNDGTLGTWQTSANLLPAVRHFHSSFVSNGYAYVIGGGGSTLASATTTSYYARLGGVVRVDGNLDLVGSQSGNLSDGDGGQSGGSVGGSITAGNIRGVGSLEIQGNATFAQGVGVLGDVNIAGSLTVQTNINILDNNGLVLGTDSDATLSYDETTDDRVELTGTGASLFIEDKLGLGRQTFTMTTAGAADENLTPTASYIEVTGQDNITDQIILQTAGAREGDLIIITNISSTDVEIDSNATTKLDTGIDLVLQQYYVVMFIFDGTNWLQAADISENS